MTNQRDPDDAALIDELDQIALAITRKSRQEAGIQPYVVVPRESVPDSVSLERAAADMFRRALTERLALALRVTAESVLELEPRAVYVSIDMDGEPGDDLFLDWDERVIEGVDRLWIELFLKPLREPLLVPAAWAPFGVLERASRNVTAGREPHLNKVTFEVLEMQSVWPLEDGYFDELAEAVREAANANRDLVVDDYEDLLDHDDF